MPNPERKKPDSGDFVLFEKGEFYSFQNQCQPLEVPDGTVFVSVYSLVDNDGHKINTEDWDNVIIVESRILSTVPQIIYRIPEAIHKNGSGTKFFSFHRGQDVNSLKGRELPNRCIIVIQKVP